MLGCVGMTAVGWFGAEEAVRGGEVGGTLEACARRGAQVGGDAEDVGGKLA